jgi:FlaA1/EpsC-like NDP-sugar epimerase
MLYYINSHFTKHIQSRHENKKFEKVLLFGTNGNAKSYIQQVMYCRCKQRVEIKGLISEDALLWKQFIHGFKVLGNIKSVIDKKHEIDFEKIVVTVRLDEEKMNEIKRLCLQNGIKLSKFFAEEETLIDSPASTKCHTVPCSELNDKTALHGAGTQVA